MPNLAIELSSIESIKPYEGNARLHSQVQIEQIKASIRRFGFVNAILIDDENRLIAGHGRLEALKQLGATKVAVVRLSHLSEAERRAYRLADNKLALNADWDAKLLSVEFEFLMKQDFEIELTGFGTPELDFVMGDATALPEEPPMPDLPQRGQTVSELGDLWGLGKHRVACGDGLDANLKCQLMAAKKASMVFADPPYNVPIQGHVSGLGKTHHDEFKQAAGEMTSAQFEQFLTRHVEAAAHCCVDGALLYHCMDWRHLRELYAACAAVELEVINLCVWVKTNGGMGSLYRSRHELVVVAKKGKAPHINNVELGRHGRYRTNVWEYVGMNSFGKERDEALTLHPTVKPVAMVMDAIKDVTHHGDLVFDGFLGSGTTLLAAERCHRVCYGVELDPRYVDVTLQRWIALTGQQPVHLESGQTFAQLRKSRLASDVDSE